jgi:hypothetical protein
MQASLPMNTAAGWRAAFPPARVTTSAAASLPRVYRAHHVKPVLADIDTDHGDPRIELVGHGGAVIAEG